MSDPCWLLQRQGNVYSQSGEDGVIQAILKRLPDTTRWCVEFGAWDGEYLSNTCRLTREAGYSAVLFEADAEKFATLQSNCAKYPDTHPVRALVGFGADDNLDVLLAKTPIPLDYDLLSIDVDGNDYHIWKATTKYRPRVVCIEFNPTVPTEVRFVQPADPAVQQGSSLASIVDLGKEKGYELVAVLLHNAIFVRAEYYPRFEIEDNRPEVLRTRLEQISYLFHGYDGTLFIRGNRQLVWHGVELDESRLQPLPKCLRKHPARFGKLDRLLMYLLRLRR